MCLKSMSYRTKLQFSQLTMTANKQHAAPDQDRCEYILHACTMYMSDSSHTYQNFIVIAAHFNLKDNDEPNEQQLQGPASVQSVDDDGKPAVKGQQEAQLSACHSTWPLCIGSCSELGSLRVCVSLRNIMCVCG